MAYLWAHKVQSIGTLLWFGLPVAVALLHTTSTASIIAVFIKIIILILMNTCAFSFREIGRATSVLLAVVLL